MSALWQDAYIELGMMSYNKEAMAVNRKMAALAAAVDAEEGQDWNNRAKRSATGLRTRRLHGTCNRRI